MPDQPKDPFQSNRELVQSFKARTDAKRTLSEKFDDQWTQRTASMNLFILDLP